MNNSHLSKISHRMATQHKTSSMDSSSVSPLGFAKNEFGFILVDKKLMRLDKNSAIYLYCALYAYSFDKEKSNLELSRLIDDFISIMLLQVEDNKNKLVFNQTSDYTDFINMMGNDAILYKLKTMYMFQMLNDPVMKKNYLDLLQMLNEPEVKKDESDSVNCIQGRFADFHNFLIAAIFSRLFDNHPKLDKIIDITFGYSKIKEKELYLNSLIRSYRLNNNDKFDLLKFNNWQFIRKIVEIEFISTAIQLFAFSSHNNNCLFIELLLNLLDNCDIKEILQIMLIAQAAIRNQTILKTPYLLNKFVKIVSSFMNFPLIRNWFLGVVEDKIIDLDNLNEANKKRLKHFFINMLFDEEKNYRELILIYHKKFYFEDTVSHWLINPEGIYKNHIQKCSHLFGQVFYDFNQLKEPPAKLEGLNLDYCFTGFGTYGITYNDGPNLLIVCSINSNNDTYSFTQEEFKKNVLDFSFKQSEKSTFMLLDKNCFKVFNLKKIQDGSYPTLIELSETHNDFNKLPMWMQQFVRFHEMRYDNYLSGRVLKFVVEDLIDIISEFYLENELVKKLRGLIKLVIIKGGDSIKCSALPEEDAEVKDQINLLYNKSLQVKLLDSVKGFIDKSSYEDSLKLAYACGQLAKRGILGYHIEKRRNAPPANNQAEDVNQANKIFYELAEFCLEYIMLRGENKIDNHELAAIKHIHGNLLIGQCIEAEMFKLLLPPFQKYSIDSVWNLKC